MDCEPSLADDPCYSYTCTRPANHATFFNVHIHELGPTFYPRPQLRRQEITPFHTAKSHIYPPAQRRPSRNSVFNGGYFESHRDVASLPRSFLDTCWTRGKRERESSFRSSSSSLLKRPPLASAAEGSSFFFFFFSLDSLCDSVLSARSVMVQLMNSDTNSLKRVKLELHDSGKDELGAVQKRPKLNSSHKVWIPFFWMIFL